MLNDTFPLRVEAIPAAHASEWRADDSFPPSETQAWQLVFVRAAPLRNAAMPATCCCGRAGLLFHQPGEVFAMTTVGGAPPNAAPLTFTHPARPWTVSAARCCTRSLPSSMT